MKSRHSISRSDKDLLETSKASLQSLNEEGWRLVPGVNVKEQGNVFLKDNDRGTIRLKGVTFLDSPEYKNINDRYTKEQALKDFVKRSLFSDSDMGDEKFDDLYAKLIKFWNQPVFTTFETAIANSVSEFVGDSAELQENSSSAIQCNTTNVSLVYENGNLFVDTYSTGLTYKYAYSYKDNTREIETGNISLPGTLFSRFELTDKGFQLDYVEPSNRLIKDLILKKSVDVKKRMESVKELEALTGDVVGNVEETMAIYQRILEVNRLKQEKLAALRDQIHSFEIDAGNTYKEQINHMNGIVSELEQALNKININELDEALIELQKIKQNFLDQQVVAQKKIESIRQDCQTYLAYLEAVIEKEDPELQNSGNLTEPVYEVDGVINMTSVERKAKEVSDAMQEMGAAAKAGNEAVVPKVISNLSEAGTDAYLKYCCVSEMMKTLDQTTVMPEDKLHEFNTQYKRYTPVLERVRSDNVAMEFLKSIAVKLGLWKTKGAQLISNFDMTIYGGTRKRKERDEQSQPSQVKRQRNGS